MKSLILALGMGVAATAAMAQDHTLRFAHQLPPQHYLAQEYETWAKDVEEKSGGVINVELFPAAQAFKPDQVFPAVAQGRIEAGMQMTFQWGNTIPEMAVMTVPYMLTNEDQASKFVNGSSASKIIEDELAAKGVHNLAWLYMGNTTVFMSNDKMLLQPEDLKGIRIRGLDKVYDAGMEAVGAEAVIMPGSEVYQALQTGIVKGAVGDLLGIESRKYYEVQAFANVTPTNAVFSHIIINPDWYAKLDENSRQALDSASVSLQNRLIETFPARAAAGWEKVKDKIELHQQTPEEAEVWKAAMQPASIEVFLKGATKNGTALIEAIEKLKN